MKVLVIISNYSLDNVIYLYRVLNEYDKMNYDIDVLIHTTDRIENTSTFKNIRVFQKLYHKDIKAKLTFTNREDFIRYKRDYDLFIYSENDMLITQKNLETFLKYESLLPSNYITGFLRYEVGLDGSFYLTELHPYSPLIYEKELIINEHRYFTIHNVHQGCFVLTREKLERISDYPEFKMLYTSLITKNGITYGILERGASEVFLSCGLKKVYPIDEIDNLLIHHLPNKYYSKWYIDTNINLLTLDELKKALK